VPSAQAFTIIHIGTAKITKVVQFLRIPAGQKKLRKINTFCNIHQHTKCDILKKKNRRRIHIEPKRFASHCITTITDEAEELNPITYRKRLKHEAKFFKKHLEKIIFPSKRWNSCCEFIS
jgi:hypothetical protein